MFRYEASWSKHKDQGDLIKQVWRVEQRMDNPWHTIQFKLNGCRRTLKQWVCKQGNQVEQQIQDKLKERTTLDAYG
jgi:hypothetical protein